MPTQPLLLFIDTNIWLDFYRARNETGLKLLDHTESISDKIIISYQLEIEFKKNRQNAIWEGMRELKTSSQIPRIGIFSDAKATKVMARHLKDDERRIKGLKVRLEKALANPALHDPVYKACQRIFHKGDALTLTRENPLRRAVRNRALRRFFHGCPPRKQNDTSIGDALNWEWIIHCATEQGAGIVIVTRDSDYGITIENKSYINDHLRHEFSERVSKKRKLLLFSRLSDALKHFAVPVSQQEEEAETDLVSSQLNAIIAQPFRVDMNSLQTLYRAYPADPVLRQVYNAMIGPDGGVIRTSHVPDQQPISNATVASAETGILGPAETTEVSERRRRR